MASSKGIIDKLKDAAASVGGFFKSGARKAAAKKVGAAQPSSTRPAASKRAAGKKAPAKKGARKKSAGSRAQDRAKVAATQPHEVRYEAEKLGVTTAAVKKAVKAVGNSRKKVEGELKK